MSMAYTLIITCAKNICKQTVLVQLIIENVVTCYFWNTVLLLSAAIQRALLKSQAAWI